MMRSAAILLAMMGVGVLLTADDATGRPFAAGRGMPFHPGIAAVPRPLAVAPRAGFHARSPGHLHAHRLRNRASGFGLWPWYDGYYPSDSYAPSAVPPYMPYEEPGPISPPAAHPAAAQPPEIKVINVIPYRPGCDTQIERLPWKEGSEKTIRIVRC